jgi:hypothetical protein
MAAWDDVIDFDNVDDWPMQLTSWLRLLEQSAGHEQEHGSNNSSEIACRAPG